MHAGRVDSLCSYLIGRHLSCANKLVLSSLCKNHLDALLKIYILMFCAVLFTVLSHLFVLVIFMKAMHVQKVGTLQLPGSSFTPCLADATFHAPASAARCTLHVVACQCHTKSDDKSAPFPSSKAKYSAAATGPWPASTHRTPVRVS